MAQSKESLQPNSPTSNLKPLISAGWPSLVSILPLPLHTATPPHGPALTFLRLFPAEAALRISQNAVSAWRPRRRNSDRNCLRRLDSSEMVTESPCLRRL